MNLIFNVATTLSFMTELRFSPVASKNGSLIKTKTSVSEGIIGILEEM